MATKLQIYNGALRRLGNPLLTSLAEENTARRTCDSVWDEGFIDYLLDRGKWSFAQRTVKITYSTTIIPAFGLKYAFPAPLDFIKLVGFWQNNMETVTYFQYKFEAGIFYTDREDIVITYVSNDPTYGGNMSRWPNVFSQYAQSYMALQIEPMITNNNATNKELTKDLLEAERMALTSDGLNKPIQVNPTGSWGRARLLANPLYSAVINPTIGTGVF